MAIKRPDIYEHNNPNLPIVDSDFVKGGVRSSVQNLNELYSLANKAEQLKNYSTQVYVSSENKIYLLKDINNIGNSNGWQELNFGGGGPASLTDVVYATGDQTIGGIKTFSNTIVGSINGNAATVTNGVYTVGNQNIGGNKIFNGGFIKFLTGFTNDPFTPNRNGINTWEIVFLNSGDPFGVPIVTTNVTADTTGVYTYFNFSGLESQLDRHIRTQTVRLRTGFFTSPKIPYSDFIPNTTGFILPYVPNSMFLQDYANLSLEDRLRKIESSGVFCLLPEQKMGIGTFTPEAKLDVNGTIKTRAIRFGQPWALLGPGAPPVDNGVIMSIEDSPTGRFSITRGGFQQIPHGFGIVLEGGYINTKRGYLTVGSSFAPTSYSDATLVWTSRILSGAWRTDQRLLVNNQPVLISGDVLRNNNLSTVHTQGVKNYNLTGLNDNYILDLDAYGGTGYIYLAKPDEAKLFSNYIINIRDRNNTRIIVYTTGYQFDAPPPGNPLIPVEIFSQNIGGTASSHVEKRLEFTLITQAIQWPPISYRKNYLFDEKIIGVDRTVVYTTGDQNINGVKNFNERPTVNNTGVLLQGDLVSDLFSGNRAIKRVPVLNQNYGGNTVKDFLTNLFFPYINASINLNSFSVYTYGIDTLSSINFSTEIIPNDDIVTGLAAFKGSNRISSDITQININGRETLSQAATLSPSITASTAADYLSKIYITRSGVSTDISSSNMLIRFEPRYYHGLSTNTSLTSSQATSLQNVIGPNNNPNFYIYNLDEKPGSIVATFNNPSNQYLYLVYPGQNVAADKIKDWGAVSSIIDTTTLQSYTNEFDALPAITINLGTKTLNYRVHRSKLPWNIAASFNLRFNL